MEIFADYHQFYLWDADTSPEPTTQFTSTDIERRLLTSPNVVTIQTERKVTIPFTLEIHDSEPAFAPEEWDHIVEASLHLPTGHLQVHECTGGVVADVFVTPGWYRVRSFHGGFDTIAEIGTEGADYYHAVLWPAPPTEIIVLRQFTGFEHSYHQKQ
jgi:hypothetical protein